MFEGDSDAIAGVRGSTTRDNGAGVYGTASGTGGFAVYATNTSTSGLDYGMFSRATGPTGIGLWSESRSLSGNTIGVHAFVRSPDGDAVVAWNSADTGDAKALYATTNSPDGYAGYFEGGKNYFEGNVGIGTIFPGSPLTVDGVIESEAGGFKFPDGTIQTTAGGGGGSTLWTQDPNDNITYNDGFVGIWVSGEPTEALEVGGNVKAEGLQLGDSAMAGYVLTADASGFGTWQPGGGGGSSLWSADTWGVNYQDGHVGIGAPSDSGSALSVIGAGARTLRVLNNAPSGYMSAVFGETSSTSGAAVVGWATTESGTATGVHGETSSPDGYGIVGHNADDTGTGEAIGVHGTSTSTTGVGVKGKVWAPGGYGVHGFNEATSGSAIGVYGETRSASGFAGYFDGQGYFSDFVGIGTETPTSHLTVAGTIESTVGGFRFPDGTFQATAASSPPDQAANSRSAPVTRIA